MKHLIAIGSAALLAVTLAGCGGSSTPSGSGGSMGGTGGAGTGNGKPVFTDFVKTQLATTSDIAEPVSVNDKDFAFNDKDNPGAYDDVTAPGN